jgi:hypothetical protein
MKKFIQDLFKDERGVTSIKPVVAFIGALFLCVTMLLNSYTHESFKPADSLVNAVLVVTCVGLGADSLDKFSTKKPEAVTAASTPVEPEVKPEEEAA